jgi:hypothetical protein
MTTSTQQTSVKKHTGACHCGAVRFEATLDVNTASRCNCSICTKLSVTGASLKPEAFALLAGEDGLSSYEFGGKVAKRFFCKNCGVYCFGKGFLEQLGGAFVSVNVNCLDAVDANQLPLVYWDGRHDNWMAGPRKTAWPVVSEASSA